jgi:hypothetical protein
LFQWIYKQRIKKIKHLFELSRSEVEIRTGTAARIEDELNKKVENLTKEIEDLKGRLDESVDDETQVSDSTIITPGILSSVLEDLSSIKITVNELSQANNAVSDAVRLSPGSANARLSPGSVTVGSGGRSGFGAAESSSQRR